MNDRKAGLLLCLSAAIATAATGTTEPMRATPFSGVSLEASGAAAVPGTTAVLIVADGRPGEVMWMELSPDGTQKGRIRAVPLGVEVTDPEGITTDGGTWFYIVGSQNKGEDGVGLVRFRFDTARMTVSNVQPVENLAALLRASVPELGEKDQIDIEGLAWDPRHGRLLLGLRAPLLENDAVVVPIRLKEENGAFTHETLRVNGLIRLPLDGDAIRGMEFDPPSGQFHVIAGASGDREGIFRLLEWTGEEGEAPRQLAKFDASLKPEGVARAGKLALVVCDTSQFAVLR